MNIPTIEKKKEPLPELIKISSTFKMIVPASVEEKIRYLIRKFPHTEWSGILFYTYIGTFEDDSLVIICKDIFPMDLGTSGWTEFKMNEDVAAYLADNPDLFGCGMGLVHSHHSLGAFFSGQDIRTLQLEGNDTNCFVSLIVDTKGTYQAAVTRKVQTKKEVITKMLGCSYQFFGKGEKSLEKGSEQVREQLTDTHIEYFMLDVQREQVNNPFDYLDSRFEEINNKKQERKKIGFTLPVTKYGNDFDKDKESFHDWLHKEESRPKIQEPLLFDNKTMKALEEPDNWEPNKDIIHHYAIRLITASLIISNKIDIKQWIEVHMERKYKEIFHNIKDFEYWADTIVEFFVNSYHEPNMPEDAHFNDDVLAKVAEALYNELNNYHENRYIEYYKEILSMYIEDNDGSENTDTTITDIPEFF